MSALIILGSALYIRGAMTRFLRYWLLRMVYEQRDLARQAAQAPTLDDWPSRPSCRPPERCYLPQPAGEAKAGREDQLRPAAAKNAYGVVERPLPSAEAADCDRDHGERQDVLVALAWPEDEEAVTPVGGDERDRHSG